MRRDLDLLDATNTPLVEFQNKVLRPILKLQNEVTILLLRHSSHFNNKVAKIDVKDINKYRTLISKHLSSDIKLRNQILGSITAMMTTEELKYYLENRPEINKRIITMQVQRYVSSPIIPFSNEGVA